MESYINKFKDKFGSLKISAKISILLVFVNTLILSIFSFIVYNQVKATLIDNLGLRLEHIAKTAAIQISPEDQVALMNYYLEGNRDVEKLEAFKKLRSNLQKIKKVNSLSSDVYTFFIPTWNKEKMVFLGMSSAQTYFGNAIDVTPVVAKLFQNRKSDHSHLYKTNSGTWVSGVAPVLDKNNSIIGGIGIDYNAQKEINRTILKLGRSLLFPFTLSFGFCLLIGYLVGRLIGSPIKELSEVSSRIISGDRHFVVRTPPFKDEIGVLFSNFNKMLNEITKKEFMLQQHTGELENEVKSKKVDIEKYQSELIKSEKMASLGQVVSGVGHEVNNPLMIIKGHSEIARRKIEAVGSMTKNEVIELLDVQEVAVSRISAMLDGLKRLSRTGAQNLEPISIHDILENTIKLIKPIYESDGVSFSLDLLAKNDLVKANETELQQVILNLINNGIYATKDQVEKSISIKTSKSSDELQLSISDNGCGIDSEIQKKIFDPFFTTKPVGEGTGIGLEVCKQVIEHLGGNISIESQLGEGSTFVISLPVSKSSGKKKVNLEIVEISENIQFKNTCLLVDDDEGVRKTIAYVLEDLGLTVHQARGVTDALEFLANTKVDLVFSDYKMNNGTGLDLLSTLEMNRRNRPFDYFFLLTGEIDLNVIKKEAEKLEVNYHGLLQKPFSHEQLAQLIYPFLSGDKKAA